MYRRMLLAYDGSLEGRVALREGAIIARHCQAEVFLLAAVAAPVSVDSMGTAVAVPCDFDDILQGGLQRARALGLAASGAVVYSTPIEAIAERAKNWPADVVVMGQENRSRWSKFFSEPKCAALIDRLSCSLLICKTAISDEMFALAVTPTIEKQAPRAALKRR